MAEHVSITPALLLSSFLAFWASTVHLPAPELPQAVQQGKWGGVCAGGEAGVEGLQQEEVRAALEHPLYDVRAATLKALLAQCKGVRAVTEELQVPRSGALGLFRAPGWRHSLTLSLRGARAPLP